MIPALLLAMTVTRARMDTQAGTMVGVLAYDIPAGTIGLGYKSVVGFGQQGNYALDLANKNMIKLKDDGSAWFMGLFYPTAAYTWGRVQVAACMSTPVAAGQFVGVCGEPVPEPDLSCIMCSNDVLACGVTPLDSCGDWTVERKPACLVCYEPLGICGCNPTISPTSP